MLIELSNNLTKWGLRTNFCNVPGVTPIEISRGYEMKNYRLLLISAFLVLFPLIASFSHADEILQVSGTLVAQGNASCAPCNETIDFSFRLTPFLDSDGLS